MEMETNCMVNLSALLRNWMRVSFGWKWPGGLIFWGAQEGIT